MEKCTRAMGYIILILFITLIISVLPTEADYEVYADTVRLHILAESDSEADQALKLKIRDRVLEKYGAILADANSTEEARNIAVSLEERIEEDVDLWIREYGFDYTSDCVIGEEWYESRYYGDFALPAGRYTSVRILLGSGEGQNWWCVMYPPLCLDMATEHRDGYTAAEQDLVTGKYVIKFKILELIGECMK